MLARSLLFAPANRPDLFKKFPQLKADLFALDLEDGTPPAERQAARWTPAGLEVLYARSQVVLAAKSARVKALDQVVLQLKDDAQFRRDGSLGRDPGCDGKMCIHPRQIELANELIAPTSAEIERARRLVAAYEAAQSRGVATIDFEGRMVDGPVFKTALSILVAADRAS